MNYSNNKLVQKLFILAITAGSFLASSSFLQANESLQSTYQSAIELLIQGGSCTSTGCHGAANAPGGLALVGTGTTDHEVANYNQLTTYITTNGATALLNKISGTVGHGGGTRYASTTAEYSALESWAQSVETASDSDGDGVLDQDDAFPNDKFESVDNDSDGVGANVDVDDNDSSVGYQSFASALAGISDAALRACLENGHPSALDVSQITTIGCIPDSEADTITSLAGLEAFKLATALELESGGFSDITPISSLIRLTYLYMSNGDSGLAYGDIAPLTSLSNLEHVELDYWGYNKAAVDTWVELHTLVLHDQNLESLPDFSANTKLISLNMARGVMSDINLVSTAPNLQILMLGDNPIADVTGISALSNLTRLHIDPESNTNLDEIAGLSSLTSLEMWPREATGLSFEFVGSLQQLEFLDLWNNPETPLPSVSMPSVRQLNLNGAIFSDLAFLQFFPNLHGLGVTRTSVLLNLDNLLALSDLQYLDFASNTALTFVPNLSGLDQLEILGLSNNAITDVSGLTTLTSPLLTNIEVRQNEVSSVGSALSVISGGVTVDFTGNPLACSEVDALSARTDINFVFESACDNSENNDSDSDGSPDNEDAFPSDPAASVDTDGDGSPDDWNPSATAEQIASSTLTVDDDDDNDGTPDTDDYFPTDPSKVGTPLSEALGGVVDPKLASCIASQSSGLDYAEQLQRLDCGDIDNLEGLRAFSYLSEFFIDNNTTDFSELAYLTRLTLLEQDNGPAPATLEPIRGNTNLKFLQLQGVNGQTFELDVIESLINLEQLRFNYSDIPTLPDFSQLANLVSLEIYRTNTQDISNIIYSSGLTHFGSYDNPLTDISPVAALTQLTRLAITDTDATDITPIAGLTALTELVLPGNNFSTLEPLSGLTQLTELWVGRNPELDLSFLPNALSLTELRVGSTGLTDLSVLANVPNVAILDISRNAISDFSPLASLDSLFELRADRMEIPLQSLGQLPAVPSLRNLWLWGNEIDVLIDTQNPWVTFHYLPSNPVTCEVQNEFLAQYPNAGIYDADNSCINGRLLERPSQAQDGYMFDSPNRERAAYYYALDDFAWAFPFALSDEGYQLGTLGGFCSSTFTIENENGGRQFFRYGSDANECEPGWDLQAVKAAMTAGGERLRIFGGNTFRWTFDHPTERNSEVIFDYFGTGNESSTTWPLTINDVELTANYLRVTRPVPGTGLGYTDTCTYFGQDENGLAGLAPQLLAGPSVGDEGRLKVFFSDIIEGGESQLFERRDVTEDTVFVCADTPAGVHEVSGVILDGRGGKLPFELTVEVKDERVSGGKLEWFAADQEVPGEITVVPGSAPSNHFDVAVAPDGRSVVAWQTAPPGGGASQVLMQRYDSDGAPSGGAIEVQNSPYGSGPVHAEWLSNDSVAITFFSYESGRYRVELRIVDQANNIVASRIVIGDSGSDYKPQDMVDLGNDRFLITWNVSPNHPQLPNQGAAAWVHDYSGNSIGKPFWLAQSSTGSTTAGWSTSTFSAVKVDESQVAVAINDRSDGSNSRYFVRTFDWIIAANSSVDGYVDITPTSERSFLITAMDSAPVSFSLLDHPANEGSSVTGISSGIATTYGVEDLFATDNGTEQTEISPGLQAYIDTSGAAVGSLDDLSTNKLRGASFDLQSIGDEIQGAILRLRALPLNDARAEGNDTIYLSGFDSSGTNIMPAYTVGLGVDAAPNNYFDFDWQIEGRPEHPAEGYEIVLDLADFDAQEGIGLSLLDDLKANRILDVIVGDDTNVDYISLEITTRAGLPAYIAVLLDPNTQRISASVLDSHNTQLIGPNTLIDNAYRFGRPSATRAAGALNSIDLIWQQDPNGAIAYQRFNADLQSVSTSNLQLFDSGSPTHLIALAPDHLRAFRAVSFDSPIDYRDIFDSTNTSPSDDRDSDGVPDNLDAFPDDPAASIDTDGDGMPDDWNPNATAEQIASSTLTPDNDDDGDGYLDWLDEDAMDAGLGRLTMATAISRVESLRLQECLSPYSALAFADELTDLHCGGSSLESLVGIDQFSNLQTLEIQGAQLVSVQPLSRLTSLTNLILDNGRYGEDFSPLSGLDSLRDLQLEMAGGDLSWITNMVELERLSIAALLIGGGSPELDLTQLAGLASLRSLAIYHGVFNDLSPVFSLSTLEELYLTNHGVTDWQGVVNLSNLRVLETSAFSDLTLLSQLPNLTRAWISSADPSLLEDLYVLPTQLTEFGIRYSGVYQFDWIARLTQLKKLSVADENLTDISGLAPYDQLEFLDLWYSNLSTTGGAFDNWTNGTHIELGGNPLLCSEVTKLRANSGITINFQDNQCIEDSVWENDIVTINVSPISETSYQIDLSLTELTLASSVEGTLVATDGVTFTSFDFSALEGFVTTTGIPFPNEVNFSAFRFPSTEVDALASFVSTVVGEGESLLTLTLIIGEQEYQLSLNIPLTQSSGLDDGDGDGVPDDEDAFPNDPAASVDVDGDGYPDAWNVDATQAQIDASPLILDMLPNNPYSWLDSDGDGVGSTQDIDDSDPYSSYSLVEDFIEEMRTPESGDLLNDVYLKFQTMGGASPVFLGGQLLIEPQGGIDIAPAAGFVTKSIYSGDTYFYSLVGRSTADGSYNVGVRVGQNALVFHPGLSDDIQGHFRHEYAAEGSDDFALNVAGPNIDMGFTPAVGVLHPVEVRVNAATGDARVTITDANNPDNVFQYDFNDPRLATGSYRLGFLTHGNPGLGVGYFDSVRIANRTYVKLFDGSLGVADLAGAFGGATWEDGLFTFPSGAESWAGFANLNAAIYPFTFEQGGYIEFAASVPSGDSVDVRFRLEYLPWPDVEPSYDTESITISGADLQVYRVELPPLGENTYESFLLYVETMDVAVSIPQVEVVQYGSAPTTEISGSYLVSTNIGSFGVGPQEFDTQWWNNSAEVSAERACFFDDEYIFGADGTFHLDLQGETWLEGWQGGSDTCAAPVHPYDGSAIASFVYDEATNTLGIGGMGAYVGSAKAVNGTELLSLADAVDSVVYNAYPNLDGSINITIESGGFWWNYLLVPKGGLTAVSDTDLDGVSDDQDAFPSDPAASVDSDGDGYPDSWNGAATDQQIADSNLTLDAFPNDSTEWIDTDGDGIGNNADDDDDNDGIPDVDDLFPLVKAVAFDQDYDGIADSIDAFPQISSRGFVDTDFDGAPDDCDSSCQDLGMAADDDDDGDGVLDVNDPEPLLTPDGVYQILPILNRGVAGPEWTVGIIGVSEADPGVDVCVADEGAGCSNIDWRFAQDSERQTVLEVEHTINTPLAWAFLEIAKSKGSNETLNLEAYRSATLSMDIRLVAPDSGAIDFNTYANCLYPCGGSANEFGVQAGAWQTIEIPVNELVQGGLDLSAVNVGFGLNPLVEQSDGVIYQVDNVRWSLRAPDLSDSDRDGLTDQYEIDEGLDPFSADTDGDGLTDPEELTGGTDPLNIDTDGDGTTDGFDAFPLDSTEFSDADGDGVGDIADNDDDNDGIDDSADLFPLHTVESQAIAADLTDANLPFGLVTYLPGADSDPAVRLGVLPQSWTLFADGSYKTNYQPNIGSWSQLSGGYVLSRETDTRVVTVTNDLQNLNWASDSVAIGNQFEVQVVSETRLAVIEQGDEIWRLAIWGESFEYPLDGSITLDPTAPVRTYRGASVSEKMVVSPTAAFEPFTAVELLGSWAMGSVNQGDNASVDYCLTNTSSCADSVTFNADNTAFAEVSGRSLTWSLNANGFVDLTFSDTGTQVRIRRLSSANDTGVALISIDTPDVHVNHLHMIVKRTAPSPADINGLMGGMLSSGFYITSNDEEYAHRSSIDGGLIDNFGFVLNADGTGERVVVAENVYRTNDLTWSLADSRLTSETCLATISIDNEDRCYYKQSRSWDLLKKTSDRIYVHETLKTLADFDVDDVFETQSSESRNNFWELTGYYDLNDFDRDGYANANDAFPTDETEWLDSDGDGIGDNSDPDADIDGDGINNGEDSDDDNDGLSDDDELTIGTSPFNFDSDGDGTPDGSDSFPLDASEQLDSDADGIGNTADPDDDNDGINDNADLFPLSDYQRPFIAADLTSAAMPLGIVQFPRGAIEQPPIYYSQVGRAVEFSGDGSFITNKQPLQQLLDANFSISENNVRLQGTWSPFGSGYQTQPAPVGQVQDVFCSQGTADYLASFSNLARPIDCQGVLDFSVEASFSLALVDQGETTWTIAYEETVSLYAVDESLVLDPSMPVKTEVSGVQEIEILAPDVETIPFTAPELLGTWSVAGIASDAPDLAEQCQFGGRIDCDDLMQVNADGTVFLQQSGRSGTWTLLPDGGFEVVFADTGAVASIRRLDQAPGISTMVLSVGGSPDYYRADVDIMIKQASPPPAGVDPFFGQFLTNGFTLASDDEPRSTIDNGYIGAFGFVINADGSASRNLASSYYDVIDGVTVRQGFAFAEINTWQLDGDTITFEYCSQVGEDPCGYQKNRTWKLLDVLDNRILIHERLTYRRDRNSDGVFTDDELLVDISRPNFYEPLPYYDANDVDRDGYPNDSDAFPTDELEWIDSDGDGIGDNSDPDADPDNDGFLNIDDAFPQDPAASADSDGDGAPDYWNDGATEQQVADSNLVLDQLPFDSQETVDTDGDGTGNNADSDDDNDGLSDEDELAAGTDPLAIDSDGDGSPDGFDSFPLDSSEQRDSDGDGTGDIADNDDDNDGIEDGADLFPFHALDKAIIATDLTETAMPFGIVTYLRGLVDDPALRQGVGWPSWKLQGDGSYRTSDRNASSGQWSELGGGYLLVGDLGEPMYAGLYGDVQNINWDSDAVDLNMQIETRRRNEYRVAVVETSQQTWRVAIFQRGAEYATDTSLLIDPTQPVRFSRGQSVYEIEILAPTAEFMPFTSAEVLGAWTFDYLNSDDVTLAEHCLESDTSCSDIVRFNADGTAFTELSNRSATWLLNAAGAIELNFVDNGTMMTLRRFAQGADTSVTLVGFETADRFASDLRMMVKRSAPSPQDISGFFGAFLSSGFYVTNDDDAYARRSSIDGGYIENFGLLLNDDGTGERVSVGDTGFSRRDLTWVQNESRVESEACFVEYQIDGELVCVYTQHRDWELIKVTDTRVYVHETLSVIEDFDQDGVPTVRYSLSRPNFYEITPYYDVNDFDRDGYPNDVDAFPTIETEWLDSDGDGIGDNIDPDADPDGDGIPNSSDAFPQQAVASVDTDGDGAPDEWNASASEQDIADSGLTLDALPDDSTEIFDSDGDGIGNNSDGDDDNDGIPDVGDAFPFDANEWLDSDGDGIGDFSDPDYAGSCDSNYCVSNDSGVTYFYRSTAEARDVPFGLVSPDYYFSSGGGTYSTADGVLVGGSIELSGNGTDYIPVDPTKQDLKDALTEQFKISRGSLSIRTIPDPPIADLSFNIGIASSLTGSAVGEIQLQNASAERTVDDSSPRTTFAVVARPSEVCESYTLTELDPVLTPGDRVVRAFASLSVKDPVYNVPLIGNGGNFIAPCVSTPTGTHNYDLTLMDGVGGKKVIPLTVLVVEERTDNGVVFWDGTATDYDNDGFQNDSDLYPLDPNRASDVDTDGDGTGDLIDGDDDNDGISDDLDAFPLQAVASIDSDGDGAPDQWNDGATVEQILESGLMLDIFPNNPDESSDSDSDGVGDNGDAFPDDPNESVDADGDGVGANSDPDDNDALIGVPNPDAILTLSDAEATLGSSVTVMMSVSDVQALNALDASISYDSAYLQLDSVSVAETLAGWNLDWFSPAPGSVNLSMFTLDELSGPADMVAFQFTLIAGSELPIPVRLTSLVLNDGQLVPAADHGSVTETFFYDVSGRVSYWGDSAVAMPATIILDNEVEAGTDASGVYSFADVQIGDHRLDIQIDLEDNRAIRAFDASLALNIAVGAIEPGPLKFLAADVNASGTVNSSDARSILRYVVGLDSLPFADQDSIWLTEPGEYEFAPLDSNVSDADFVGVLVGDVSGNWQPATDAAKSARVDAMSASGPVTTMVEANADGTFTVTLSLNEARDLSALDFELSTTSGVTLDADSVEVLVPSSWSSLIYQAGNLINFGSFALSASPVQDIVRMTLSVSDDQQMLESILLFLDEESHEQSLAFALAVDTTDTDEDGLTDLEEAELGTNPELADSDSDGIPDGEEVELGTNPLASDTDGDAYSDGEEVLEGTSPLDADDQPLPESKVWLYQLLIETARERSAAQP